jgi:hypothetical protein
MVCFSTFFTAMKKSIDLKLKKCTKTHCIIYSVCTHLQSNTIEFSIYDFFCNLLQFFKLLCEII